MKNENDLISILDEIENFKSIDELKKNFNDLIKKSENLIDTSNNLVINLTDINSIILKFYLTKLDYLTAKNNNEKANIILDNETNYKKDNKQTNIDESNIKEKNGLDSFKKIVTNVESKIDDLDSKIIETATKTFQKTSNVVNKSFNIAKKSVGNVAKSTTNKIKNLFKKDKS